MYRRLEAAVRGSRRSDVRWGLEASRFFGGEASRVLGLSFKQCDGSDEVGDEVQVCDFSSSSSLQAVESSESDPSSLSSVTRPSRRSR